MKKINILLLAFSLTGMLFAQENESIELPDVTTVINGETITAGIDSLPDFGDVLVEQEGSGNVVPVLPEVDTQEKEGRYVERTFVENQKIYAEGQLGGGAPSLFKGDFTVYSVDGENPFTLSFHHNSSAGYSKNALTDGFNDRDTSMAVEKTLSRNKFSFTFGGLYETAGLGFQNKVENISNYDNDLINAYGTFNWNLPKNFSLGTKLDAGFYNRFSDITSSGYFMCPDYIRQITDYGFTPAVFGAWKKDNLNIDFNSDCWFGFYSITGGKMYVRGNSGAGVNWDKDSVKVFGKATLVYGSTVEGEKVIAPFSVGVEAGFPVTFSNRKVGLSLEGGLDSYRNETGSLEKQYKYSYLSFIPDESSEWYGKFDLTLPLKSSFTGNAVLDFRKTAFDNGRFMPVYSDDALCYGMYGYELSNVTMFSTEFNIAYHYKLLSLTAGWHSNWIDVPVLESPQMILLNASLQSDSSAWGVNLLGKIGFGSNASVPVIDVNGFVRLTPAVRIVIGAEDVIKLVSGEKRKYAGQYYAQGGNVSALVKFFF